MTATTGPAVPASGALHTFKVVVVGSFAVGKSTLIRKISDSVVVGTEAPTSGAEADVKATTTVGMEFGTLTVGEDHEAIQLLLYGLPGQERFGFMWDIVATGADGYLVLADAERRGTVDEALDMVDRVLEDGRAPVLVAVNRVEGGVVAAADLGRSLAERGVPWVRCEVPDVDQVRAALVELLVLVLERLDAEEVG